MAESTLTSAISTPCSEPPPNSASSTSSSHVFLDGRDTAPTGGAEYIAALQQKFAEYGVGQIASVSGRYYAMDRDRRWERELKTFDAMVKGHAEGGVLRRPYCAREGVLQQRHHR